MSRENQFAAELSRLLKNQGAIVCSYVASSYGLAGFPDKIVISRQWVGFMELKSGDRKLSAKQLKVLREINRRRAWIGVEIREVEDAKLCHVICRSIDMDQSQTVRRDGLLEFLGGKVNELP